MKINGEQLASLYELVCRSDDIDEIEIVPSSRGHIFTVSAKGQTYFLNADGEYRPYEILREGVGGQDVLSVEEVGGASA